MPPRTLFKITLPILFTVIAGSIAQAQSNSITGSVQDESGKLLHYVFVGDGKYKGAAFTDSLGNFNIAVHTDSKLLFQLDGYQDTLINAKEIAAGGQVILKSSVKLPVETTGLTLHTIINEEGQVALPRRANVAGSRYLFGTFAHGFFTDTADRRVYNQHCLFNYEKISGFLLLTADKHNVREIDRGQVKSFTLYDNTDQRLDFEQVPEIDKLHYLQVLTSGARYKIFKLVRTKYIPSDVAHTASGDRGEAFDQYVDNTEYYVLDVQTKQVQKVSLKKKAIKEVFPKEAEKVNKFMSENTGTLDEAYLGKLGSFVNS